MANIFNYLTPNAETVLEEILSHCDPAGNCDSNYWESRFEDLSFVEDNLLRSTFKELIDEEMISVEWVEDYPYCIAVLNLGKSYSIQKARYEKTQNAAVRRTWIQCLVSGIVGALLTLAVQNIIPIIIAVSQGG